MARVAGALPSSKMFRVLTLLVSLWDGGGAGSGVSSSDGNITASTSVRGVVSLPSMISGP